TGVQTCALPIYGGIVVNFFMGRKGDKVEYRINDREWTNMSHFEGLDPAYYTLWNRWNLTEELIPGRRPSNPVNSTHLWQGNIPARQLGVGTHTTEVRATDMFGRTFTQQSTITVQSLAINNKTGRKLPGLCFTCFLFLPRTTRDRVGLKFIQAHPLLFLLHFKHPHLFIP